MTKPCAALAIMAATVLALAVGQSVAQPQQMTPIVTTPPTAAQPQKMAPIATTPPAAAQPQKMAPIATTPPAAAPDTKKFVAANTGHRWRKADARVCLEFPNDMQVIKCSENYR